MNMHAFYGIALVGLLVQVAMGIEPTMGEVKSLSAGVINDPTSACATSDGFVVVWPDGSLVKGQTYDKQGAAVSGGSFSIGDSSLSSVKDYPMVTCFGGSTFLVTWSNTDFKGLVFTSNPPVRATEFTIRTAYEGSHSVASLLESGRTTARLAVIAWKDGAVELWNIETRQRHATRETLPGVVTSISIVRVVTTAGGFVVTWARDKVARESETVAAQRFGADGKKVGSEIIVVEVASGAATPTVAPLDDGFVITYTSSSTDIAAATYSNTGGLISSVVVNEITDGFQVSPFSIAVSDGVLACWSNTAVNPGIYCQLITKAGIEEKAKQRLVASDGSYPSMVQLTPATAAKGSMVMVFYTFERTVKGRTIETTPMGGNGGNPTNGTNPGSNEEIKKTHYWNLELLLSDTNFTKRVAVLKQIAQRFLQDITLPGNAVTSVRATYLCEIRTNMPKTITPALKASDSCAEVSDATANRETSSRHAAVLQTCSGSCRILAEYKLETDNDALSSAVQSQVALAANRAFMRQLGVIQVHGATPGSISGAAAPGISTLASLLCLIILLSL